MTTYYDTLEISPRATQDEIRAAYRRLSQRWHPDKNLNDPKGAEQRMRAINEAYRVLSDAASRRSYDDEIEALNAAAKPPTTYAAPTTGSVETLSEEPFRTRNLFFWLIGIISAGLYISRDLPWEAKGTKAFHAIAIVGMIFALKAAMGERRPMAWLFRHDEKVAAAVIAVAIAVLHWGLAFSPGTPVMSRPLTATHTFLSFAAFWVIARRLVLSLPAYSGSRDPRFATGFGNALASMVVGMWLLSAMQVLHGNQLATFMQVVFLLPVFILIVFSLAIGAVWLARATIPDLRSERFGLVTSGYISLVSLLLLLMVVAYLPMSSSGNPSSAVVSDVGGGASPAPVGPVLTPQAPAPANAPQGAGSESRGATRSASNLDDAYWKDPLTGYGNHPRYDECYAVYLDTVNAIHEDEALGTYVSIEKKAKAEMVRCVKGDAE